MHSLIGDNLLTIITYFQNQIGQNVFQHILIGTANKIHHPQSYRIPFGDLIAIQYDGSFSQNLEDY